MKERSRKSAIPPFGTILVPYDGSPDSDLALQAALYLALQGKALLKGLFVVDRKVVRAHFLEDLAGVAGAGPFLDIESQSRKALERIGHYLMETFKARCRKAGVAGDAVIVDDTVPGGILAAARRVDLVVMGKRGAHELGDHPVGSNVERVARHSPVPVLVVPSVFHPIRSVLAGYDGSPHSKGTVLLASSVACWLQARLTILHVCKDAKAARKSLVWAERFLSRSDRKATLLVKEADPSNLLPKIARVGGYDLLVLGAYGKGFLREFLIGSITDLVLRETLTPLLIHR